MNNILGLLFVVECSMFLYDNKKSRSPCCIDLPLCTEALSDRLKVCTSRSAALFEVEWQGEHLICLTPFDFRNTADSAEVNLGPLSVTTC